MAPEIGDRVVYRSRFGHLTEIWKQEEPAPQMGAVAFDVNPSQPELCTYSEIQLAADAPPPPGSPWAQAVADLAEARAANAALRARVAEEPTRE